MEIDNILKKIICDQTGIKMHKINSEMTIAGDLMLAGDDVLELINEIKKTFNLNAENFDFYGYFDPEGFDPLGLSFILNKLLNRKVTKRKNVSISIGDLQNWITLGHWVEPNDRRL